MGLPWGGVSTVVDICRYCGSYDWLRSFKNFACLKIQKTFGMIEFAMFFGVLERCFFFFYPFARPSATAAEAALVRLPPRALAGGGPCGVGATLWEGRALRRGGDVEKTWLFPIKEGGS